MLFAVSEALDRFPSAVVGSGGASFPLEVAGALKEIIEAPDVSAFRALDGRDIVAGALKGIEQHTLPEAVREDYLTSYAGDRFAESAAYVRSYPSDLPVLAERLADITTPVQIIAGRHDALVPPSNAEFLHARLANSKLDILETGHFTWEDGADDYLALTRSWIDAHRRQRVQRVSSRSDTNGRHSVSTGSGTHLIVLPGGGYADTCGQRRRADRRLAERTGCPSQRVSLPAVGPPP